MTKRQSKKQFSRKGAKTQRKAGERALFLASLRLCGKLLLSLVLVVFSTTALGQQPSTDYLFNDSHFHLTNYIQEGADIHDFLKIMGNKAGRVALFGIPLQQQWSYRGSWANLLPELGRATLLLLIYRRLDRHRLPVSFKARTSTVRSDDHGIQSD
jgi:hypothetical protein